MIEEILIDYLSKVLPVPVYAEMPSNSPKKFVIVEKTGGGEENYLKSAMVAVQSYGETLLAAAQLNNLVKSAMENLADNPEVCKAKLNTDYNFTDTATKRYRYQAVFDIFYY